MMKLAAAAAGVALLAVACGGGPDTTATGIDAATEQPAPTTAATTSPAAASPAADDPQRDVTVVMTDNLAFEPASVVLEVGGTVTWVNESTMDHTSTANIKKAADETNVELPQGAKPWDSGFVKPDESFSLTFDKPGTYRYFCIPHEKVGMTGIIEVVE